MPMDQHDRRSSHDGLPVFTRPKLGWPEFA